MTMTPPETTSIIAQLHQQRAYFTSGATRPLAHRRQLLQQLYQVVLQYEQPLREALHRDLRKSEAETWVTETGFVLSEISETLRELERWMRPKRVKTNLLNLPSRSEIHSEPLGVVLIIAPWNYPFQLLFSPLVGAIAAGNTVLLKPSEFAPHTAAVMTEMITKHFSPNDIAIVNGDGAQLLPPLLHQFAFDHIFYTGSTAIGKKIYQMAAEHLVPVTLELGGKSPVVVAEDANITVTAKRIAVAKWSNAGQMCVTPDYVLVHASQKAALIAALIKAIEQFHGVNAQESTDYGRIINLKQFERLQAYLAQGEVVYGGKTDAADLYISPTLLTNVPVDAPVMKDEIFGPILPILTYDTPTEALAIIQRNPNPLAFYVFTANKKLADWWLQQVPAGGSCINNTAWHLTNPHLPFGGRGNSGIGHYHGQFSFDRFSHQRTVMHTPTWFDPAAKYPPMGGVAKLKLLKWLIK